MLVNTYNAHNFEWEPTLIRHHNVVTNEPIEFEKQHVQIQDFKNITDPFRGSYRT